MADQRGQIALVHRRIGGLEIFNARNQLIGQVHRRIGGLEK